MSRRAFVAAACLMTMAGASLAESAPPIIYGRVDVAVAKQNDGTTSLNGGNGLLGPAGDRWDVKPGSAGRIGFYGKEDLGQKLNASFRLEMRFQSDTGLAETPFFQARSFVELGSGYGSVYLGREYIPAFWPAVRLDPWGFDTVGSLGPKHQFALYTVDGGIRSNNTVGYRSLPLAGLTTNVAVSAGEGLRKRAIGANLEYTQGPLYAGAGYDGVDSNQRLLLVGGAYDFGAVRPAITYVRSKVAGVRNTNLSFAATSTIGVTILKVAAARLDPEGDDNDTTRLSAGFEYLLSKRTSIYGDAGSAKQQGKSAGKDRTRTTAVDFGLKHMF